MYDRVTPGLQKKPQWTHSTLIAARTGATPRNNRTSAAHAGGEIRKLDGREFVVLSGRHHPVKAYEILDICLRNASAADFACILAGRGSLRHQG